MNKLGYVIIPHNEEEEKKIDKISEKFASEEEILFSRNIRNSSPFACCIYFVESAQL